MFKSRLFRFISLLLTTSFMFTVGAGMIIKAPQFHGNYLRDKVGSQVIMITNEEEYSGGTGFAVKTPSGRVLTLTNAHVCSIDNGKVFTRINKDRIIPLVVIEKSKTSDLCLLSSIPGKVGLEIASSLEIGEELGIVGHPRLFPLALTRGQYIGEIPVSIGQPEVQSTKDCDSINGKVVQTFFGLLCVKNYQANITTIVALPGNSGSPVVNFWGNVTGVLFAGNSSDNWGVVVKLEDVKSFLQPY